MLAQGRRRWADVVQMLYKCFFVCWVRAARRVKILFFWDAEYAWRDFFTTRDSSGYCDWSQSNAEKISEAQRGAVCSLATAMINGTVHLF